MVNRQNIFVAVLVIIVTLLLAGLYTYFRQWLGLDKFLPNESILNNYALTVIRVFTGPLFIIHGLLKVKGGQEEWLWTGEQMKNLGINSNFMFWGLAATLAELGGGISLVFGLATRLFSALLAFTMLVATIMHIRKGDPFGYISFPLGLLFVFLGLLISGSGPYSIDRLINNTAQGN